MEQTHDQKMKELRESIRLMKQDRQEKDRPSVWYNKKMGLIEIRRNGQTILAEVTGIDTTTPRENSDEMARGSSFRQIIYKTEVEEDE